MFHSTFRNALQDDELFQSHCKAFRGSGLETFGKLIRVIENEPLNARRVVSRGHISFLCVYLGLFGGRGRDSAHSSYHLGRRDVC